MGYRVYDFGRREHSGSEAEAFFRAAEKARAAVEEMHDLACEMEDRYGERFYGMRNDGYGMRENYPQHDGYGERGMWGERRMRDSRGRFM